MDLQEDKAGRAQGILDDCVREAEFASAHGITVRTDKRYRDQGMPYLKWGGKIWIHPPTARTWLLSRMVTKNPTTRKRKRKRRAK